MNTIAINTTERAWPGPLPITGGASLPGIDFGLVVQATARIRANQVTLAEFMAWTDQGANKNQIYADFNSDFALDLTNPDVRRTWSQYGTVGRSYDVQRVIDGVMQTVARGSFLSNARFTVDNFNTLTPAQKTGNYFLQTVERKEETFDAAGGLLARDTTFVAEGFATNQAGGMNGVDTHSRTGMLTGYTLTGKPRAVKTVWTATFSVGYGNYDGRAVGVSYSEFYNSTNDRWDATKLRFAVQPTTYTLTFTLNADNSWVATYTGAITGRWTSLPPKK